MAAGWILETVISGGQTGVDQVALEIAQHLGYKTGGWAPRGWTTDAGPAPWLGTKYGLQEHRFKGYAPRTRANVKMADATVWFGAESPGYLCTMETIRDFKKPCLSNPSVSELQEFILKGGYRILNAAGNRLRTHPEATATARVVLTAGLLPF
jgi:hypothetical protein